MTGLKSDARNPRQSQLLSLEKSAQRLGRRAGKNSGRGGIDDPPLVYTPDEAATALNCSPAHVRAMIGRANRDLKKGQGK